MKESYKKFLKIEEEDLKEPEIILPSFINTKDKKTLEALAKAQKKAREKENKK